MNDDRIVLVPMSKSSADEYLETVSRLESDIHMIDSGAFYASASISLKRIADILEAREKRVVEYHAKIDAEREAAKNRDF